MTSSPFNDLGAGIATPAKSQSTIMAGADANKFVRFLPQFYQRSLSLISVKMVEELQASTLRVVVQDGFGKSNLHHVPVNHAKDSTDFLPHVIDELVKQSTWGNKSQYLRTAFTTLEVGIGRMTPVSKLTLARQKQPDQADSRDVPDDSRT